MQNPTYDPDFYQAYINSPEWRSKRQLRLAIDGHRCQTCLHDGSEWRLEIHHKTYKRLGDEDVHIDLVTLCSQCHEAITSVIRARRYANRKITLNVHSENGRSWQHQARKTPEIQSINHGTERKIVTDVERSNISIKRASSVNSSQRPSCRSHV